MEKKPVWTEKKNNNAGFIKYPKPNRSQQNDAVVEKGTTILRCINKKVFNLLLSELQGPQLEHDVLFIASLLWKL